MNDKKNKKSEFLFSRNLIKGGIAEIVFERMFAETNNFLIVPFGYEKTVNILTQINKEKEAFKIVTSMPDYVLINRENEETYIVEVKYKSKLRYEEIKKEASDISAKGWSKVYYFLATPGGFYFSLCKDLIEDPKIIVENKLSEEMVSHDLQELYLEMLNEFEK